MALDGPNLPPIPDDTPQYVPVFPFYEAEPTWFYKGYGTSGGDGGSDGDDDLVLLFSETVTTMTHQGEQGGGIYVANLNYQQLLTSPTIIVTFDGTEYVCSNMSSTDDYGNYGALSKEMGGFDFSTYPFNLFSVRPNNVVLPLALSTSTDAPHIISVKVHQSEVPGPSGPNPK